jgi:hypothetical protein
MRFAVEMGSGAMICISSFIRMGSSIHKSGRHTARSHKPVLFFQNRESSLIRSDCRPDYFSRYTD